MNDQISLEEGWNNEPLKDLYPTQAHINHPTKWLEMLAIMMVRETIKIHLHRSNFMSTRFILDLERAAFKMTHIKHRVSRTIIIAEIDRTWCRTMNDQMALEEGWNNAPLKELYPT